MAMRFLCGAALLCLAPTADTRSISKQESYDFVIVGGGLAGSVLANRLSASGNHSVLVLNVADAPPEAYHGPVMITDEYIVSDNITADDGLRARIQQPGYRPVPHFSTDLTGSSPARMLGGSTLVALSLYLRDHPEALDAWGQGWSWEEMRPYFHRAEGLQGTATALRESDYGQDGPYKIQYLPAYTHPLTSEFLRAAQAAGLPWAPDLNTERGTGVGLTPTTQWKDGSKVHAYDAYLRPALRRTNLEVLHGVRADRLVIKDRKCRGVAYRHLASGTDHVVRARKEVILASGYIYSPRLLFLSGIGARKDLEAVGLPVVKDLPAVGRNLTAARFSPLAWRTSVPTLSQMMGAPISPSGSTPEPAAYGSAVLEATARARSSVAARMDPGSRRPDIILSFSPLFYAPNRAPMPYSLQGEDWPLKTNAYSILATLGETRAQGSVTFPAGSPDESPVVTHDAMTHPEDLARAREAVELARKIGAAGEFTQPTEAVDNGAGMPDTFTAVYDGRGTCRMGSDARDSVVDHELRVHGVEHLRIVDGSVIPVGSPYLAVPEVLAVAERGAEIILDRRMEVAALEAPESTISVADLSAKLGSQFSLLDAVAHLAGAESPARLSGQLPTMPLGAVFFAVGLCTLAASAVLLAVVRLGKAQQHRDGNGYTAFLA